MKLGIHLSTFTPAWEDDVLPFVKTAADIGYRAVEFPLMFPDQFDYKMAGKLLRQYGLSCTCGTGMNMAEDVSSTDREIRNAGINRLKRCVEIASYLESDCLGGVLYAPWGQRMPRTAAADRYQASMESLCEVAEFAAGQGVTLSLELLNRYESFFINNIEEGLAFIKKTGKDNIKLYFDTFHAHIEECSMTKAIELGGSGIWHVHLCDNNRGAPGSGAIDFELVLDALGRIGYDRFLMVENFVIPDSPAGKETCIWTKRWKSPEEDAAEAFEYIDRLMKKGDDHDAGQKTGV